MSDSAPSPLESTPGTSAGSPAVANRPPLSPNDVLPPVEPPSAGFLLQLFVIPGVIVALIVMLYWGVNKLAHGQADPHDAVEKIKRKNSGSWQAASTLTDQLRNPQNSQIRSDAKLAAKLAEVLNEELDDNQQDDQSIVLRYFLAKSLGEFEVADGLPVLLKAAETARDEKENEVRLAALEAIAVLAVQMRTHGGLSHPRLTEVLMAAADSQEPTVRTRAAIALGAVDDPNGEFSKRLERMLEDPYPDARFNAASHLARKGNAKTLEVLTEMLDPDEKAVEKEERALQANKRVLIVVYGLRSLGELKKHNPGVDLSSVMPTIEKLRKSPDRGIETAAETLAQELAAPPR